MADHALPTPSNPAVAGFVLFLQPCKIHLTPTVNALGLQPGNWARAVFGNRTH